MKAEKSHGQKGTPTGIRGGDSPLGTLTELRKRLIDNLVLNQREKEPPRENSRRQEKKK